MIYISPPLPIHNISTKFQSIMKAYVILAHKNPGQLIKLVNALNDDNSIFFIHIDKRKDIGAFTQLKEHNPNVRFLSRVSTSWASIGIVDAVITGLQEIQKSDLPITAIILLSGQDYPIKSNKYIDGFITANKGKIFLESFKLPNSDKWQPDGGMYRVNKYYLGLKIYQRYSAKALNLLSKFIPVVRRKIYKNMVPYAGSMWWIINMEVATYILTFLARNPLYHRFHRYTFAADEVFFHTILLNAGKGLPDTVIINDDKRFINWKDISSSHPDDITSLSLEKLIKSPALFARKFDIYMNPDILDLVEEKCRDRKSSLVNEINAV